jgi:hypothetical protein
MQTLYTFAQWQGVSCLQFFMAVVMFTTSVGVINKVHHCLAQESKSLCQENESCCENEVERNAECCHDDVKAMLLDVTYINKQQKHTIIDVAFSVTIFIKQLFVFLNDTKKLCVATT